MGTLEFPVIETERLVLREIVMGDAPALFEVHGDPESMRWFGVDPLANEAAAHNLIELFASWRTLANPGVRWGIQIKGSDALSGTCGLFAWNRNWRKCTVGYELNRRARGQGYMREALTACFNWGFTHMQLNRIEAQIHQQNLASLRLAEAFGFKREGVLREVGYWGGEFHDLLQYSLLRKEWK